QRIDIAADGWMNDDGTIGGGGDYIGVVQAALAGWGRYYGKARWSTEHLGSDWNGFAFGTRSANKFLRCYRKKREMKAKGMKPHVIAAWDAALGGCPAMKDPREVGRLEVQLKGRELNRYVKVTGNWDKVASFHDPMMRASVHQSTVRTMFDFRTYGADGRARSAKDMAVWDYTLACAAPPPVMKRDSRRVPMAEQRVKMALHWLHDCAYLSADSELMNLCTRMAVVTGMVDYMHKRQASWAADCDRVLAARQVAPEVWMDKMREKPDLEYLVRILDGITGRAARDARNLSAWQAMASRITDAMEDEG
ncbi:MAG: hypothetical protein N2483_02705, partial [Burkholderiaceae bacterium]|nr:hypothetical protein [Burkholderiaceae bacterium]